MRVAKRKDVPGVLTSAPGGPCVRVESVARLRWHGNGIAVQVQAAVARTLTNVCGQGSGESSQGLTQFPFVAFSLVFSCWQMEVRGKQHSSLITHRGQEKSSDLGAI